MEQQPFWEFFSNDIVMKIFILVHTLPGGTMAIQTVSRHFRQLYIDAMLAYLATVWNVFYIEDAADIWLLSAVASGIKIVLTTHDFLVECGFRARINEPRRVYHLHGFNFSNIYRQTYPLIRFPIMEISTLILTDMVPWQGEEPETLPIAFIGLRALFVVMNDTIHAMANQHEIHIPIITPYVNIVNGLSDLESNFRITLQNAVCLDLSHFGGFYMTFTKEGDDEEFDEDGYGNLNEFVNVFDEGFPLLKYLIVIVEATQVNFEITVAGLAEVINGGFNTLEKVAIAVEIPTGEINDSGDEVTNIYNFSFVRGANGERVPSEFMFTMNQIMSDMERDYFHGQVDLESIWPYIEDARYRHFLE